ncbi:hypothetical protein BKA81DRAFT_402617 [Phyllosticta paracitricarpa]|uniref:GST C-terminal domain-containing protein n=1 Tax=Phyllosticta citricarpa TaxID=55181 RepID=A0ABR1MK09_9PEZI
MRSPSWSPDGKQVVHEVTSFTPTRPMKKKLYSWDGDWEYRFTDVFPQLSNQGRLAITQKQLGNSSVVTMDPDGNNMDVVFDTYTIGEINASLVVRGLAGAFQPSCSPDGEWISFGLGAWLKGARLPYSANGRYIVFRECGVRYGLRIIDLADKSMRFLTNATDNLPYWSPDGERIVFTRKTNSTNFDVCTIRPDGSDLRILTWSDANDAHAVWSHDGRILYNSGMYDFREECAVYDDTFQPYGQIMSMYADGSNKTMLTDRPARRADPRPTPTASSKIKASYLDLNWHTPRIHQVPMLLEELREIHGFPGMVKIISKVLLDVRNKLNTVEANKNREAKLARKQLQRLNFLDPDPEKFFHIFVTLAASRIVVQRELLALDSGLSVPHAKLKHDNLLACAQHLFDRKNDLSFDSDDPERVKAEMWIAWEHFHLAKMQTQAMEIYRPKGPVPVPVKDPIEETERLYKVLDGALGEERSYLAGEGTGRYSIADIAVFSWVNVAYHCGIRLNRFPNVEKWWARVLKRPAIKSALETQKIRPKLNAEFLYAMEHVPMFEEQEEARRETLRETRRQFIHSVKPLDSAKSRYARDTAGDPMPTTVHRV